MKFKFNGGMGAILCSNCGVILKSGSDIPQDVVDAIKRGVDISKLPDWYCEDGCKKSMEFLDSIRPSKN